MAEHFSQLDGSECDRLLQHLVEATAPVTGEEFFRTLTQNLSQALNVKYVWVAEFANSLTRVRTLAFYANGGAADNFEYDLANAPCEKVYESGSLCHYRDELQQQFPADKDLITLDARSYLGVPLRNPSGEILGHIALIDTHPFPGSARELSIFRIFADRARAELERIRAERLVEESNLRLSGIMETAIDAIVTFDRAYHVTLFNQAAETLFQTQASHVIGQSFLHFCSPSLKSLVTEYCEQPSTDGQCWIGEGHHALRGGESFPVEGTLSRLDLGEKCYFTVILRDIEARKKAETKIRILEREKESLKEELQDHISFKLVAESPSIRKVIQSADRVAKTDSTVLLTGETGTGKEMFARYIHEMSPRRDRILVPVNCAALPAGLVESELFGHEKGAFTGAVARKRGKFEAADGGTILLDEIGELSMETQAKILRVLQESEFEHVGGTSSIKVNVRIIAATNRDLEDMVQHGNFRADLFYRLNVFPIHLPPLRDRVEDLSALVHHFMTHFASRMGKRISTVSSKAVEKLIQYTWPGNIRELANVIERAVILCDGNVLLPENVILSSRAAAATSSSDAATLEEAERQHILQTLEKCNGVVGGPTGAAKALGLNRTTLLSKMKRLGIKGSSS